MTKLASLLFITSLLILLLTSCNIRPPFTVFVAADNTSHTDRPVTAICAGGIKTRLSVQGRTAETPLAPLDDSRVVEFVMPEFAPIGTEMTTEAWCYSGDNVEVAYVRVLRPYTDTKVLTVAALAPFSPPIDSTNCQPATETRGPEICVISSMYGEQ